MARINLLQEMVKLLDSCRRSDCRANFDCLHKPSKFAIMQTNKEGMKLRRKLVVVLIADDGRKLFWNKYSKFSEESNDTMYFDWDTGLTVLENVRTLDRFHKFDFEYRFI